MSHFWRTLQICNNSSKQTKKLAHSSHYALFGPQFMGHTVWTTVCAVTFWAPLPWCKRDGRGGFLFCVRKLSRCYSLLERVESHSFVARRIILLWRRLINRQRSMVKPFCATRGRQTAHRKQSIVCNCFVCFIFPSLSNAAHSLCLGLVLAIDPPYQMQMQLWIQGQEGTPLKHLGFGTMRHQPSPFWVASTR